MWAKERFKPHFGGILWLPAYLLSLILRGSLTSSNHYQTITSWQIDGETVETVLDFIFLGSKITADDDCSHEIKDTYFLKEKL